MPVPSRDDSTTKQNFDNLLLKHDVNPDDYSRIYKSSLIPSNNN